MAQDNQVSASLTAEQIKAMKNNVVSIKNQLNFLVNLTPQERQSYPKMADKTVAFVSKSLEYGKENPNLVPPYLDFKEFEKDMKLVADLQTILRPLRSLVDAIDDTVLLAGSEAYSAALTFYSSVKIAEKMNVPGISVILSDLKQRYPGKSNNTSETDSSSEEESSAEL